MYTQVSTPNLGNTSIFGEQGFWGFMDSSQ
jgi:hypothetical protein